MVGFEDLELLLGTEPYYTSLKTHVGPWKKTVYYTYTIYIYMYTLIHIFDS